MSKDGDKGNGGPKDNRGITEKSTFQGPKNDFQPQDSQFPKIHPPSQPTKPADSGGGGDSSGDG